MKSSQEESTREQTFKRNRSLEHLLLTLNDSLSCAENKVITSDLNRCEDFPIVFIMGAHRSGTTLFMQWLANSRMFECPTNILSRFYGAPVIGAQIQLLLTDPRYNFRNEILDFNSPISFESENGKTKGALAPNEFWYFWRRFIPFQELDWLSDEELFQVVDSNMLVAELTSLTRVFGKPFALKSMILNYNIPFLDAIFNKAIFIQIKRDPITNVASILEARRRQLGSEKEWYSFKIPEYEKLKKFDPVFQATGQLHFIDKAVNKGMSTLDENRRLVVKYEEFCSDPRGIYEQLIDKLGLKDKAKEYDGPNGFNVTRDKCVEEGAIESAMAFFKEQ